MMIWCFWTVVLEKTLESPLDSKEIKLVNPKEYQSWIFIQDSFKTDDEAPILWPPEAKSQLTGKDPDAGKDWRQKERGWQGMRWSDSITDSGTWICANSGRYWRTEEPGMPQSIGSQRAGHNWMTEKQQQINDKHRCSTFHSTVYLDITLRENWSFIGHFILLKIFCKISHNKQPRHGSNIKVHQQQNG